jgi:Icc-related predicted phosphoesterase
MDTRVTVISDTHCRHDEIDLPAGDLLIHCGDMFDLFSRTPQRLFQMDQWFGRQEFDTILYTGGNHDRELEAAVAHRSQPLKNAHYLSDEAVEFRGLRIFGAPWVPDLSRHAFFKDQPALARTWGQIPPGIDILVTHTPPKGILDKSRGGQSLGCPDLAAELQRISPRVHCFGHVHASAGHRRIGETLFINASSIESGTGKIRPPITFTLSSRAG